MADVQIVMKDGRNLKDYSDQERQEVYAAFVQAYYVELSHDVATKPEEYAWTDKSQEEIARVVSRMMTAIYHGRANNSNALKRAAKRIGLNGSMKYTEALVQQSFVG